MDENLHNIDEIFNEAHRKFSEKAPESVWEKLQAGLDKQDAGKFRRRFIGWKRTAILLMFLLSGFVIYETNLLYRDGAKNSNMLIGRQLHKDHFRVLKKATNVKNGNSNIESKIVQKRNLDSSLAGTRPVKLNKKAIAPLADSIGIVDKSLASDLTKAPGLKSYEKQPSNVFRKLDKVSNPKKPGDKIFGRYKGIINTDKSTADQKVDRMKLTAIPDPVIRSKNNLDLSTIGIKKAFIPEINIVPTGNLLTINSSKKQSKQKNKKFAPYWSVTPFISNDWGMYIVDNDVPDNLNSGQDDKAEIENREKHEESHSIGAYVTRYVSKHVGIKTGFVFSNTAIGILPQEIYANQYDGKVSYKYITSSGYGFINPDFGLPPSIGDSIESGEAQHNLQVVSIPVSVSFKIDRKKFSFVPSAGLTANYITSATVKTEVSDALNHEVVNITKLKGTRRFYTGFISDLNVQYNLNSKLAFSLLPTFRYALSPITESNVVETFPYSFSIGAGLTIKF